MEVSPAQIMTHPSNPVELAFYDVLYVMQRLSNSAKGRRDNLNPKLALQRIAEMEERIAVLKSACEQELVLREEAARIAAEEEAVRAAAKTAADKLAAAERRAEERRAATLARQMARKLERARARVERANERAAAKAAASAVEVSAPVVEAVIEPTNVIALAPKAKPTKNLLGRIFKREAA